MLGSLSILPSPVIPRQTDGRGGLSGKKGTHCDPHRMNWVHLQCLGTAMVMMGGGASLVFSSSMAVGGYRSEPLQPQALTAWNLKSIERRHWLPFSCLKYLKYFKSAYMLDSTTMFSNKIYFVVLFFPSPTHPWFSFSSSLWGSHPPWRLLCPFTPPVLFLTYYSHFRNFRLYSYLDIFNYCKSSKYRL